MSHRSRAPERRYHKSSGILFLPELSDNDKVVEKDLLRKRFEMLSNGHDKSRLTIRNLKLYLDGNFVDVGN